jgi:hypothetical protein
MRVMITFREERSSGPRGMEDIDSHERHIPSVGKIVHDPAQLQRKNRDGDGHGSINGMEKAKTGHRPDGQSYCQRMGRVFTVDEARIAQKMEMNKSEEKQQIEATAYLFLRFGFHRGF